MGRFGSGLRYSKPTHIRVGVFGSGSGFGSVFLKIEITKPKTINSGTRDVQFHIVALISIFTII
jgi:hypothetical protein